MIDTTCDFLDENGSETFGPKPFVDAEEIDFDGGEGLGVTSDGGGYGRDESY